MEWIPRRCRPSSFARSLFLLACLCSWIWCLSGRQPASGAPVSYDRDIRPILAARCFKCHGPDDGFRQADLRLDVESAAKAKRGGVRVIVPRDPAGSELMRRVTLVDSIERMPPAEEGDALSAEQIATLCSWIEQGAAYQRHWAFETPTIPQPVSPENAAWARNEIDLFVLDRLQQAGLFPSPEADRYTLVRRVFVDLIGLPPTPEEADAFARDRAPRAFERLVDRLLASPRYGERWARPWLDLARYADTNGYEKDRPRSIWPYRDWVIRALNGDMPYDQFTIEQLAGDMLPRATLDQRIATGFHRNTMLNEEGGIDPLEYRYYAVVDRVATTGTVWLGMTIGCAQCHTHKYDPISHTDYFRLFALHNNADEPDLVVPHRDTQARRRRMLEEIARLEARLADQFPPLPGKEPEGERRRAHLEMRFAQWLDAQRQSAVDWTVIRPSAWTTNLPRLELLGDGSMLSTGDVTKRDVFTLTFSLGELDPARGPITGLRLEVLPDDRLPGGGPGRSYYEGRKGEFFLSELVGAAGGRNVPFVAASHSFGLLNFGGREAPASNVYDGDGSTGWSTATREGERHQLVVQLEQPVQLPAELQVEMLFERHFAASLGRFRCWATCDPVPAVARDFPLEIEALVRREPETWSDADRRALLGAFLAAAPELAEARKPIDERRARLVEPPRTMVMQERPADNPRPSFRHHRGEYLQPRESVTPGVPAIFPPLPEDEPSDRLALARWLVGPHNPLAARVAMNRAWQAFFGVGLVRTSGDFGVQGDAPTHPQLLDWLACEFVSHRWSHKELHRMIVLSATYRQSSEVTPELREVDPENRLLARGPRFRIAAEAVRDLALAASGLLTHRIGGPSVYPPQPASVTALAYGATPWEASTGADRYRRSLYTFSKRTAPFAAYAVFDAPSGENCTARRDRSNTPLQALTLLNDEMFLEAARRLGAVARRSGRSPKECVHDLFRRCLTRPPADDEVDALLGYREAQLARLRSEELDAAAICGGAEASAEQASWVMLARVILNLDEMIAKP